MKTINIKLDDDVYETFITAAKLIAQSGGVSVPIPQLAEAIINAELNGMDAKKLARKFIKSLTDRISGMETSRENERQEEYGTN